MSDEYKEMVNDESEEVAQLKEALAAAHKEIENLKFEIMWANRNHE